MYWERFKSHWIRVAVVVGSWNDLSEESAHLVSDVVIGADHLVTLNRSGVAEFISEIFRAHELPRTVFDNDPTIGYDTTILEMLRYAKERIKMDCAVVCFAFPESDSDETWHAIKQAALLEIPVVVHKVKRGYNND